MADARSFVGVFGGLVWVLSMGGCGSGSSAVPADTGLSTQALSIPERNPELLQASAVYGELIVHPTSFSEAESDKIPWSGYWYPTQYREMWEGTPTRLSPLQKYDQYMAQAHGRPTHAVDYERDHLFYPNVAGWEGMCNAWALAALLEPEPNLLRPVTLNGVTFNTGDLKALLLKTYENAEGPVQFGQRNRGGAEAIFEDIYADQFHAVVQNELFLKRRSFMMDKDPDLPVWNTPVWKAQMKIAADAQDNRVMHVQIWLFGADPHVQHYDDVGTIAVTFPYTYDLYGYPTNDGGLRVQYGKWTGDSVEYHPDYIAAIPDGRAQSGARGVVRGVKNPEVDIQMVDEILRRSAQGS